MVVLQVESECPTERVSPGSVRRILIDQLPVLRTVARSLCRTAAEIEELVQEALDKALGSLDVVEVRRNPRGWMVKLLHDLHIDRCRARAGHVAPAAGHDGATPAPGPAEVPAWSEATGDDVRRAAAQLPDELRAVYVMFALEGRSYAEIAAGLRIAPAAVATRLQLARTRLKQILTATLRTEPT